MSVLEIIETIFKVAGVGAIIIVPLGLIKVTPLQINIWSWLARKLGNAMNHDILDEVKNIKENQTVIENKLDEHIAEEEKSYALDCRNAILHYSAEILKGEKHTQEQFNQVLEQIDDYENYCDAHPKFQNNRCLLAIDSIKKNYQERLEKADFLAEDYRVRIYNEHNISKEN